MVAWVDRSRYHLALGALATGLALAPARMGIAAAAAVAAALAAAAMGGPRLAAAVAALLLVGTGAGEWRLRGLDAPGARLAPFERIDERAVLLERPRPGAERSRAEVRLASGRGRGAKLLAVVRGAWRGPDEPGTVLRVRGLVRPPIEAAGDAFDWAAHLRRRGIAYELHLSDVTPTAERRGGLVGAADSARRRAERVIEASLTAPQAALMRGMVLGQDEEIDPLTRDDWRDSGLAHLLAVSGQNVMLLCALALPFLALTGISPRWRVAVLLILIALYVPLAGAGPSLQRAAVMGAAGLVALAAARPASGAYALLLAAAATLALNPRVSGDPGWQLSFAAVTGLLAARPAAPRGTLAAAVWLTGVASLATAPLLALHFEAVPLASVAANLLALPAVAPVMWAGMLDLAAAQLAVLGGSGEALAHALAGALALLAAPLLAWLDLVAREAATLPGAVLDVRVPGPAPVVAAYAVVIVAALGLRRLARIVVPRLDGPRERLRFVPRPVLAVAVACAALGVALALSRTATPPPPERLTVSFLDVGQGDATLVQDPSGAAVLFDGGRPEARVARLVRRAGVRRLGAVVATHASADHHGGLAEVVRRFPVDLLLDGGDGSADPSFRALLAQARGRGARVVSAAEGMYVRVGAIGIRVLSPEPRPPGPAPADPNPRAIVAVVESEGFELLLSADAESPTLASLDLPDVEAMKVPHHGSADPGLPAVLERLRPEIAVIQVGENTYGHPHPDTLAALRRAVPHVRRTDRDGTVRLSVVRGRVAID